MSLEGIVPQEFVTESCYLQPENKSPIQVLRGKPAYQKGVIWYLRINFGIVQTFKNKELRLAILKSLLFIDTTKLYIIRKGLEDKCHGFCKYQVFPFKDSENASYSYIINDPFKIRKTKG